METQHLLNNPEYLAYMKTVDQMIHKLPKTDQLEIRREISSHITKAF